MERNIYIYILSYYTYIRYIRYMYKMDLLQIYVFMLPLIAPFILLIFPPPLPFSLFFIPSSLPFLLSRPNAFWFNIFVIEFVARQLVSSDNIVSYCIIWSLYNYSKLVSTNNYICVFPIILLFYTSPYNIPSFILLLLGERL